MTATIENLYPTRVLVTGGAGFIGSALVRFLMAETDVQIINLDKLTYAACLASLDAVADNPRYTFVQGDVACAETVDGVFTAHRPDIVIHLAAESHVDRSIDGPGAFVRTNIDGTFTLLHAARRHFDGLSAEQQGRFRFLNVSTDEIYGSLGPTGLFDEDSPIRPSSPYSASKAAADHLVQAWFKTYGLPTIITNCSNNYGPHQFPEKLIPLMILKATAGEALPIYGSGLQVRDWLHVEDHARALWLAATRGTPGRTYLVGGESERTNLAVVEGICAALDARFPEAPSHAGLMEHVSDRPGHDQRYAIDPGRIQRELGWKAQHSFEAGLRETVDWYLNNKAWWAPLQERYRCERLGMGK